jgi:release factor glutamine methyltransferase
MLEWGTDYLEEKGVDSPRLSMEWLLAHLLDIRRLDIYLQFDRPLSSEELGSLKPLIKKRARHEPLQYITGSTEFMGCKITVNPSVLIPRQETEQLTERILEDHSHQKDRPVTLLDIGTGSGCIPIAIKKHAPAWDCYGVDISEDAIRTAIKNAELNHTNISFIVEDLFNLQTSPDFGSLQPDIVVSNPPYITPGEKEELDPQVLNYEPTEALFHENPVQVYRQVARYASSRSSQLYLECNHKLASEIVEAISEYYARVDLIKDLDQKDRFIIASEHL